MKSIREWWEDFREKCCTNPPRTDDDGMMLVRADFYAGAKAMLNEVQEAMALPYRVDVIERLAEIRREMNAFPDELLKDVARLEATHSAGCCLPIGHDGPCVWNGGRCSNHPVGSKGQREQCCLPAGHEGGCKWGRGD